LINILHAGYRQVEKAKTSKNFYLTTVVDEFAILHPHEENKEIGPAKREFVKSRAAACVLIYCPSERKVLMSRQFRVPVFHDLSKDPRHNEDNIADLAWIYEIVAGVVEDGESGSETVVREAEEEVGIFVDPNNLNCIGKFYPSPGMTSEHWSVYTYEMDKTLAVMRNGGLPTEAEAIVSEWITYEQVKELLNQGRIIDAKTYIALKSIGM